MNSLLKYNISRNHYHPSIDTMIGGTHNGFSKPSSHQRRLSQTPFAHTSRRKPRRWPLALRFIKGAIHGAIIIPVILHALFAVLVVVVDRNTDGHLGLPPSIIPSLSIVVGLMLVFRNQTSYNRFWNGRNYLTVIITSIRNLTRSILTCSPPTPSASDPNSAIDTERTIKILTAILYATKNHLRACWGACIIPGAALSNDGDPTLTAEYADLIPSGLVGLDHKGVGIPLQLTFFVEGFIQRGVSRGWFHAPQASQMSVQLNTLVDAYGRMETIRLTPIPVAHLIHQKQVLALFGIALPFAMVTTMGWWAVPITSLVIFTLYGIDGIASRLEDPFGKDKIDINLDAIVEDVRAETLVLLDEWRRLGEGVGEGVGEGGEGEGDGRDWFIRGKVGMGDEEGVARRVRFEE